MNAIRSISSDTERKEEVCAPAKNNHFINGMLEKEKLKPNQENNNVKKNEDERIKISISRKAYHALEAFTKEFDEFSMAIILQTFDLLSNSQDGFL